MLRILWASLGSQIISCAADGEIRVWNYRKSTCMATFEAHDGKIWAFDNLEINNRYYLASGGTDSILNIWEDDTLAEEQKNTTMTQEMRANLTELDILLREKEFEKAIKLAFDLDLRRGFVKAMYAFCKHFDKVTDNVYLEAENDMMIEEKNEPLMKEGKDILTRCLEYFVETDLHRFLGLLMVLITANKYSYFCGLLLNQLVKKIGLKSLDTFTRSDTEEGVKAEKMLTIIKNYHKRHFERYSKFKESLQLIDFYIARAGTMARISKDDQ